MSAGPANLLAIARRAVTPSEHEEQAAVIAWAATWAARWPCLALLYATPNGGHRHKATAGRLKAEGVRSGVPDLVLPAGRGGYLGLYLELKKADGSLADVSDAQRGWLDALAREGYATAVAFGAAHAIRVLTDYCERPLPGRVHRADAPWPHTPVFPARRTTRRAPARPRSAPRK